MLTKQQRESTYENLVNFEYTTYYGSVKEINSTGITKTIENIIQLIVERMSDGETYFLIDGQFSKNFGENSKKIVKGDLHYYSIAAASILAKVERDRYMEQISLKYPNHGFSKHKGYGTKFHQLALQKFGVTDIHRSNYNPIKQLLLDIV